MSTNRGMDKEKKTPPLTLLLPQPGLSGWIKAGRGRPAQVQIRNPRWDSGKSHLRSLAPWTQAQVSAMGDWASLAPALAVFSGRWGSSCCLHPQPPLGPHFRVPSPPLVGWRLLLGFRLSVRRDGWPGRLPPQPYLPWGSARAMAGSTPCSPVSSHTKERVTRTKVTLGNFYSDLIAQHEEREIGQRS